VRWPISPPPSGSIPIIPSPTATAGTSSSCWGGSMRRLLTIGGRSSSIAAIPRPALAGA
jgi:hypothetical protein